MDKSVYEIAIITYLEEKRYALPYTEKDMIDAINFGIQILTEQVNCAMIGMVVNGTCQSVLTEAKFKELLSE